MKSVVKHSRRNPMLFCYFSPRPAVWRSAHDAPIPSLNFHISPDAIVGAVLFRVVDPFNCEVVSISMLHSPSMKCFKATPLVANCYPFPVVVDPARVAASCVHSFKYRVNARSSFTVCSASFSHSGARSFASTRDALASTEVCAKHRPLVAALTSAEPKRASAFGVSGLMNYRPRTKREACKINQSGIFSHA